MDAIVLIGLCMLMKAIFTSLVSGLLTYWVAVSTLPSQQNKFIQQSFQQSSSKLIQDHTGASRQSGS
jgi:uncharacterized membrane protein